jgi:hypothetical protein
MRIDSGGAVEIGGTTNPNTSKLFVAGGSGSAAEFYRHSCLPIYILGLLNQVDKRGLLEHQVQETMAVLMEICILLMVVVLHLCNLIQVPLLLLEIL